MCGIHGFVNGKTKAEINTDDFIRSGFIANMLRGMDSSGLAIVTPSGYNDVAKIPLAGMYLPAHKPAASLITRARAVNTAAICHVRAATAGAINHDNAHPFDLTNDDGDSIVGVHNGTLTNWRNKKWGSDYDVDSAWALSRILEENADAFEEITGAFAFVWWASEQPGVLNMARNKERSLFLAYTEDDNMVYASEAGMIHWLCERHRIKLKGAMRELEEGKLYKFDITNPTEFTKSILPTAKPVATPIYQGSSHAKSGSWGGDWGGGSHASHSQTTVDKLDAIFANVRKEETTEQLALIEGPKPAELVTKEEVQDAHTMDMLGLSGEFTPIGADDKTGYLYGTFEADTYRGESHAVMRDVSGDLDWSTGQVWKVKVQGINDSGNDFIIIVSKPTGTVVAEVA